MAAMFNLAVFRRLVVAAASAGILAGLLLTAVQQIRVIPILLEAEGYEEAAAAAVQSGHPERSAGHTQEARQPATGGERAMRNVVSNLILAIGFALLLGATMVVSGRKPGWRSGVLWGLAGYAVFFVAPSLGLPPEVPGTEAARLPDRQLWWLMTVLFTAAGLSSLVFARTWAMKVLGVVLLGTPHMVGAPQALVHGSTAPAELEHSFIHATVLANFVFWLCLGGLLGLFYRKMA